RRFAIIRPDFTAVTPIFAPRRAAGDETSAQRSKQCQPTVGTPHSELRSRPLHNSSMNSRAIKRLPRTANASRRLSSDLSVQFPRRAYLKYSEITARLAHLPPLRSSPTAWLAHNCLAWQTFIAWSSLVAGSVG